MKGFVLDSVHLGNELYHLLVLETDIKWKLNLDGFQTIAAVFTSSTSSISSVIMNEFKRIHVRMNTGGEISAAMSGDGRDSLPPDRVLR